MIALDAADVDLVHAWCRDGSLPFTRSLLDRGSFVRLDTVAEWSHSAVWPCLFTGTNPGKHGIYNIFQAKPAAYDIQRASAAQCAEPPFWKHLDEQGRKCIVVDAPFDCPIPGFGGIQVFEWGSWVRYTEPGSRPESLWGVLVHRWGTPPIEPEATAQWSNQEKLTQLHDWLIQGIEKKEAAVKWLVQDQDWDLFLAFFPEIHPAGHFFWHLHDHEYPGNPPFPENDLGNLLKKIYERVDTAAERIAAQLREDDILLIVSGDRIGPNFSGWHLLPPTLTKLGFMSAKNGSFQTASGGGVSNRNDMWKRLRDRIPVGWRREIRRLLPERMQFRLWKRWTGLELDWPNSKTFCIPNDCQGHIRINVKGREPLGAVERGKQYDQLCSELKERLGELINPGNGQRAVRDVARADRLFSGQQSDLLPDLIVQWDEKAKVSRELSSQRMGVVHGEHPAYDLPPYYVGNHRGPGFALLHCRELQAGSLEPNRHIYDIAPTILSLFHQSPPSVMDGTAWSDVVQQIHNEKAYSDG